MSTIFARFLALRLVVHGVLSTGGLVRRSPNHSAKIVSACSPTSGELCRSANAPRDERVRHIGWVGELSAAEAAFR
jgi:hypothetical protein